MTSAPPILASRIQKSVRRLEGALLRVATFTSLSGDEERAILANEVKIRVRFGAPKHGTEVVDCGSSGQWRR